MRSFRDRVPYTTRERRWWPLVLSGVLLVVASAGGVVAVRTRGTSVDPEAAPPLAYRIVYAVVEDGRRSTQALTVRRPYDGRNELPDAAIVATAAGAWRIEHGTPSPLGGKAPSTPPGDARPRLALERALREGLAERAGSARIAGRACERFAVAEPLGKPLSPPGPVSRTELCVDRAGLVLEERWSRGSAVARVRRAQQVELDPALDEVFPSEVPQAEGITRLEPGAPHELRAHRITPPPTFRLDTTTLVESPGARTLVDAYTSGPNLLLVEQTSATTAPWVQSLQAIALEPRGELVLDLVASQLRIDLGSRRWLRLSGSVAPADLESSARSLQSLRAG